MHGGWSLKSENNAFEPDVDLNSNLGCKCVPYFPVLNLHNNSKSRFE